MNTLLRFTTFAAPSRFYALTAALDPWLWTLAIGLTIAGLYIGFFVAPTDATQGDSYRIIFIHVPAAWMSMILYLAMAFWAGLGWMLNARMASMLARAIAPTGAMFTFLALWTGAFWGKPTWGTWWVWDARLTSELILLFLYLGYIALVASIDDAVRGDKAGAVVALVGAVNVPIIYFSVKWWNTLHQGATISMTAAPKMAQTMLMAMLLMTFAFWAYAFAVVFARARALAVERERDTEWVRALAVGEPVMNGLLAQWGSWSEFWSMRGYGLYVWGSYAATLLLMLLEPWLVARHRRRALESAAQPHNEDETS